MQKYSESSKTNETLGDSGETKNVTEDDSDSVICKSFSSDDDDDDDDSAFYSSIFKRGSSLGEIAYSAYDATKHVVVDGGKAVYDGTKHVVVDGSNLVGRAVVDGAGAVGHVVIDGAGAVGNVAYSVGADVIDEVADYTHTKRIIKRGIGKKGMSFTSRRLDRGNKGYLDEIEQAVRNFDKNGDGVYDIGEVFEIVDNVEKERAQKYFMKKSLITVALISLGLLGAIAGLMYSVIQYSKEMSPDPNANLVDHKSKNVLATHTRGVKLAVDIDLSAAFTADRQLQTTSDDACEGPVPVGVIPKDTFEHQWTSIVDGSDTHFIFASGPVEVTVLVDGHDLQKTQLEDGTTRYTGLKNSDKKPTVYHHVYCNDSSQECKVYKTNAPTIVVTSVTTNQATFALRTDFPAEVQIEVSKNTYFDDIIHSSNVASTATDTDCTGTVIVKSLKSETQYYYRLLVDGAHITPDYVQTFRTNAKVRTEDPFSFVVFADSAPSKDYSQVPTYKNAGHEDASFAFQIGDFDHSEPQTLNEYRSMHRNLRNINYQQGNQLVQYILSKMSFYHIWNDNDYCGENSGGSNCDDNRKADAFQAFREYYPNYPYGSPSTEASNYYSFNAGNAEFIVLDTQSQRTNDGMLGMSQLVWLKNALLSSRAKFKFIVSSVTANKSARPNDPNHWSNFQNEANEIRSFLESMNLLDGSVIMVSGDLHSGGAIDKGCNNWFGIPEISVAPTNFRGVNQKEFGDWSEGVDVRGNPGYVMVIVENNQVMLLNKQSDGSESRRLVIDLQSFNSQRNCST